jgi:hypothetical protein
MVSYWLIEKWRSKTYYEDILSLQTWDFFEGLFQALSHFGLISVARRVSEISRRTSLLRI